MRVAVLLLLTVVAAVAIDAWRQLHAPLPISEKTIVDVPRGKGLRSLLSDWQARGLFSNPRQVWYLAAYSRLTGKDTRIKSGEYEVGPGLSAVALSALLVSGRGLLHELLIIEGWTFQQALDAVNAEPLLEKPAGPLDAASVMEALGHPDMHPEGRFYPDTYRFPRGTDAMVVMRQSFELMSRTLKEEWEGRPAGGEVLKDPEDALILASIIERETGLASERGEIAGVFTRRLRRGMLLQTDPTVIYGLGDAFDGNLRKRDLEADTPYNTYTRRGLPPTPICLPGRASIHAALHPAPGETLYFVARGDGSHEFSRTIEDHNAAVRKYQLRRSSR